MASPLQESLMLTSVLITLLVGILIIGLIYWIIMKMLPVDFKTPALFVLAIIAIIWLITLLLPVMRT